MKKHAILLFSLILTLFFATLPTFAAENGYIFDTADYLTDAEEQELEALFKEASADGVRYVVYTSNRYIDQSYYPTLAGKLGFSASDDLVLFAVYPPQRPGAQYGYNLAVFGRADAELSDAEYNGILDHYTVMDNIYEGNLLEGLSAVPELTAYRIAHGRDKSGVGFLLSGPQILLTVAATLAVFLIFFFSVRGSYRKKNKGGQYPLDNYSKTKITNRRDRYSHRHISVVTVSNNTSGGGGRSGGGGARGGGR